MGQVAVSSRDEMVGTRFFASKAEGKLALGWTPVISPFLMAFQCYRRGWHGFCSVFLKTTDLFRSGAGDLGRMKHRNSHLLVGYWSRIRRGRDVPDQTDIDPRAIKRVLSYAFILDCENPTRPVYRLGGTALCERFGLELKGTGFLAHWDARSALSLAGLLRQSLQARKPLCLSSVAVTASQDATELETILTPVSFNGGQPRRFFGLVQLISDPTPLIGRVIAYEKLMASRLIEENEPSQDDTHLPPPPTRVVLRSHPRAPYLGLVVSDDQPNISAFGTGDFLQDIFDRLRNAANANEQPRFGV